MIIINQSNVKFDYALPDGSSESGEKDSNVVNTEVLTYSVSRIKSSNKVFIKEGETAVQTVVITNNSSTTLIAPFFKDTMTAGASYVNGSVVVDNIPKPTFNLTLGFNLPDIAPTKSVTVSYSIVADNPLTATPVKNYVALTYTVNDPIRGPVAITDTTNDVFIEIVSAKISVVKSVDKTFANKGDFIHYTTIILNTGTLIENNLTFKDAIPMGTTFVNDSVKIDGISKAGLNPSLGFSLPNLLAGASVKVEFDVKVN